MSPRAIIESLRQAGLLRVADRAAAQCDLPLKYLVATGVEPTQAHETLWRALAEEGQTPGQIATLVRWPESLVAAAVAVAPPKREPPRAESTAAPKRPERVAKAKPIRLPEIPDLDVGAIPAPSMGLSIDDVGQVLLPTGIVRKILGEEADRRGVLFCDLLGTGRKTATIADAREAAVARLTLELGWSRSEIARAIGIDQSTVGYYQRRANVAAAHRHQNKRAA